MGDWGVEPWETDEAADWFHRFWTKGGVSVLIDTIENFDEKTQAYEEARAAAYLLQVLGIVFVWPVEYAGKLAPTLDKAIHILNCIIEPPNEDWCYLEMGGDRNELIRAVQEQLIALRKRREGVVVY